MPSRSAVTVLAVLASVAVDAASVQTQQVKSAPVQGTKLVAGRLVGVSGGRAVRPDAIPRFAAATRFVPLSAAQKSTIINTVLKLPLPTEPSSEATFTLTPNTPIIEGKGFVSLNGMHNTEPWVNQASGGGPIAQFSVNLFVEPSGNPSAYLAHFQVKRTRAEPFKYRVTAMDGSVHDFPATLGTQDVVLVLTRPADGWPRRVRLVDFRTDGMDHWDFLGVEVTPF